MNPTGDAMSDRQRHEVKVIFTPAGRPRNLKQVLFLIWELPWHPS
jgi:hypothetical protein